MGTTISGATGIDKVQDGTIVNADINSSAAIAGSKLVMPTGSVLQVVQQVHHTFTQINNCITQNNPLHTFKSGFSIDKYNTKTVEAMYNNIP